MSKTASTPFKSFLPGAILFLFIFLYFLSYFNYGINLFDEGILMEGIRLETEGRMQYDKFCHFSSQYRFLSYILNHTENDLLAIRLIWVFARTLTALLIFVIARRLVSTWWALIPVILFAALPGPWHKSFVAFLTCLPVYLMIRTYETGKPSYYLATGCSIALAVSIHIYTGLLTLIPCAAFPWLIPLFSKNRLGEAIKWKAKWYALFWLVVVVLSFVLADFLRQIDYPAFISMTLKVLGSDHAGSKEMVSRLVQHLQNPSTLLVLTIYFGTVAITAYSLARVFASNSTTLSTEKKNVLIIILAIAVFNLAKWFARFDMAHLLQNSPPVWILGAGALYHFRTRFKDAGSFAKPMFVLLSLWFVAVALFGFSSSNYYFGGIGYRLFNDTVKLQHPKATMHVLEHEALWIMQMDSSIRENTSESDYICVLAPAPILYYLSERKNPLVVPLFDRPETLHANPESEIIAKLKASKTRLIVYKDEPTDGVEEYRISRFAPALAKLVTDEYTLVESIDEYQIRVLP